jgi:predicted Zn-ribbon and HTH transcriptional regulator
LALPFRIITFPECPAPLSQELGLKEKEVTEHLEHLRRRRVRLRVTPAACLGCGFVFRKRDRLTRPGRCPLCRGESVSDPVFAVEPEG